MRCWEDSVTLIPFLPFLPFFTFFNFSLFPALRRVDFFEKIEVVLNFVKDNEK
ncbi:hypothetical protein O53_3668 [Microcystis aeruginosa TAIHU98]|uniref:Uncharacterized protein n=1 Tax=Microcystis aeruginosa TAIHU98 TaxID=1134457 RepID=L7E850_MICAE|nr:hypothetical protein O53_3668 [Microcystis aeruginosa TAIHU98]